MPNNFSENAHWRDSARPAKFFVVDAIAVFPLFLFLLHIRWWSFAIALSATLFFGVLSQYGFTLSVFGAWVRLMLAGKRKYAISWWER